MPDHVAAEAERTSGPTRRTAGTDSGQGSSRQRTPSDTSRAPTSLTLPTSATDPRTSAALPSAVLWDMDGTLVDTEPFWIAAEYELVGRFGGLWTDADAHAIVGKPLLVSAAYVRARGGVPMEDVAIVEALMGSVVERVRRTPCWRPGARELVAALSAAGVPQALVTMSWTPLADAVLAHLPTDTFACVVTGDRVTHGKPHPEPYETALSDLAGAGADARTAVAIEDSPTGLASAEAAGVRTLAVPHVVPVDAAPGRRIVGTLAGLRPEDLLPAVSEP